MYYFCSQQQLLPAKKRFLSPFKIILAAALPVKDDATNDEPHSRDAADSNTGFRNTGQTATPASMIRRRAGRRAGRRFLAREETCSMGVIRRVIVCEPS